MPTDKPRVTFTVSQDTLQKIDEFRFTTKAKNQTQAILALIEKGLSGHETIKKASSISDEAKDIARRYDKLDSRGKMTVKTLLECEEKAQGEKSPEQTMPTTKIIPLYLSPAAAGYTSPILGEDYEDYEVPASADADYAVRVDGDSMEPYIKDKSVVLVKKTVDLKDGDVGIFSVDNDMYCKQYCQDYVGNVYLFSLNRKRKDADITIWNNSGQTLWCFGKVLMKKRVPLPRGRDI